MRSRGLGMGLSKIRIGDVISQVDERNSFGITDFYGINIFKEFMPTVANTENLDNSKYKIVRKNRFVYSGMQTGRDKCIRISMFMKDSPVIVSPAYTTFEVDQEKILPEYFFMLFLSKEKDRLGWFHSDGSVRANLDWDVFCDLEFEIPDVPTQQKYVDIYDAMCANQKAYEKGLDDLKLTCDAYIEELRRKMPCEKIGPYIQECDSKNSIGLTIDSVRGIATSKELIPTKANMDGVSLENYKVVAPLQITYVPDTSRRGDKISLGINKSDKPILVSSISIVFETEKKSLLSEYLMLFFVRSEFDRYARFNSWGSARETFDWNALCDYKIPIPDITTQKNIAEIYKAFNIRKNLNEKLKQHIKNICPILIKGAVEEGKSKRG
jgi:type I restriction enzyme S subunit